MNVRFFAGTKQQYLNLAKHNPLALYFCADTNELFWGDRCLSDGARVVPTYDDLPAVTEAADGIIYYVADTRNGYVLAADRADWTQVIYAPGNGGNQEVDLSDYYTKLETETAINAAVARIELPDVSGFLKEIPAEYITEAELEARGYLTEHQDLSNKADLVHNHDELYEAKGAAEAVKNELLNGAGEAFDTLKELGTLINDNKDAINALELIATGKADKEHTHDQYLTEQQDLSDYALKSEIPSIDGLATEQFVKDSIDAIEIPETNLSNYYDKIETEGLITKAIESIEHPTIDLDGYATEDFVNKAISGIQVPDVSNFITMEEVEAKGYIDEVPAEYVTERELEDKGYLTEHQDLSDYAKKSDIPEAELFVVDFNAPDFAAAVEAYNNGKLLLLVNAAPDINGYAVMNYVRADLITFTKFLTSRSEAYGSFNTYYLHSDNTWEISKEVKLNKVEANVKGEIVGELATIKIGKEIYSIPSTAGLATEEFVRNAIADAELSGKDVDLSGYATKTEVAQVEAKIPSVEGLATEDYVTNAINAIPEVDLSEYAKVDDIPTDYLVEADLEGYSKFSGSYDDLTNKPEIPSITGLATEEFVAEAIADIEFPEVDLSNYVTKAELPSLDGYAKVEDIPDVSSFITEVPEEYVTETDLTAKGFITEHQDVSHLATKEEIPDVSGFISEIPDNYITDEELNSRGYLTEHQDISGKADKEHTHSYNELTDRPEIPSIAGLATEQFVQDEIAKIDIPEVDTSNLVSTTAFNEALAAKADEVPFEANKFVTISVGNFVVGESVKGLTVAQILAKLLGLSDGAVDPDEPETPEVPQGIIETIIAGQLPMYQVNTEGQLEEVPYNYISLTSEQSVKEPTSAGFYQILDSSTGAAIESGYQQLSAYNEDIPYLIALPSEIDFNTHITVQKFDDGFTQQWVSETLDLTNDIEEIQAVFDEIGQTLPTVPEGYTLWADLGRGSDTSAYRFIITE